MKNFVFVNLILLSVFMADAATSDEGLNIAGTEAKTLACRARIATAAAKGIDQAAGLQAIPPGKILDNKTSIQAQAIRNMILDDNTELGQIIN